MTTAEASSETPRVIRGRDALGRFAPGVEVPQSVKGSPWFRTGLTTRERRWRAHAQAALEFGGYGGRRKCRLRAWESVVARRIWEWSNSAGVAETLAYFTVIRWAMDVEKEIEDYRAKWMGTWKREGQDEDHPAPNSDDEPAIPADLELPGERPRPE